MNTYKRKLDTRNKIQMGGLVIKAGLGHLHEMDKAVLLGLLIDAGEKLHGNEKETYIAHCKKLGEEAFGQDL